MPERVLYQRVTTTKSPDQVRNAGVAAMRYVGGSLQLTQTGFVILDGKLGATMGIMANASASVNIQKISDTVYEYQLLLHWEPGGWFWGLLAFGIFTGGLLSLAALLYFLFNPTMAYQAALGRIPTLLEPEQSLYK